MSQNELRELVTRLRAANHSPKAEWEKAKHAAVCWLLDNGESIARRLEGDGAVALIAAERRRQIEAEGWTPDHDDAHQSNELAAAAACYAAPWYSATEYHSGTNPRAAILAHWPWALSWWKPVPNDRVRELVKAGALIVAEIERLQRAAPPSTKDDET